MYCEQYIQINLHLGYNILNRINESGVIMNTVKDILYGLIEELPDKDIPDVIDFVQYLKLKREKELFKDLQKASESSLKFWNNDIDDEVWNNV